MLTARGLAQSCHGTFGRCLVAAVLLPAAICLAAPFSVDLSQGEVSITLTAEPPAVSLAQDLMLTLTVETPSHLTVALPDLRDRFSGFTVS